MIWLIAFALGLIFWAVVIAAVGAKIAAGGALVIIALICIIAGTDGGNGHREKNGESE